MVSRNLVARGWRRGFTLIELLVVISIIALLIGLLLPALSQARLAANNTLAAADLKGVSTALYIYSGDQNNFFPTDPPKINQDDPAWNDAGQPLCPAPLAVGNFFQTRYPGHTWFDSAYPANGNLLADAPNSVAGDARYYKGLGKLLPLGYMTSADQLHHPVMRAPTQTDTGGGARRHWYYYKIAKYSELARGATMSNSPFGAGSLSGTNGSSRGLYLNNSYGYRNGFWATYTGGTTGTFVLDASAVSINNNRPEANKFNSRVLLMGVPYENQFNRQGGKLDVVKGDGSVTFTTHTVFKSATGNLSGDVGSTPACFPGATAPVHTPDGGGANQGAVVPVIDSTNTNSSWRVTLWNDGMQDGWNMDFVDRLNGVAP